jgi:membrane associated rhomboid family serine protease
MGIYDRDYARDQYGGQSGPRIQLALPPLTPVVKWLLIINVVVWLTAFMIPPLERFFALWFSVFPANIVMSLEVWRLISYQFLHGDFWHIFFNMYFLFIFGPMLERLWGSREFLKFYLICGAMGGVLYTLLVFTGVLPAFALVGASGAILGLIAAGAVLFPNVQIYMMFIFPMPLKIFAIICACLSIGMFFRYENPGGQAAHLAGMAAGVVYVLWPRWKQHTANRARRPIKWESDINRQRAFQAEVDRILDKVHKLGIGSLTRKEKKILRKASQHQQQGRF